MIKYSLIIPSYNQDDILNDCISKILNQIEANQLSMEVIIVDDASTDKTYSIAKSFDKVSTYRLDSNSGSGGMPRNYGMEKSQGQYFLFYDLGDEIFLDKLDEITKEMENNDLKVAVCNYEDILPDGSIKATHQATFRKSDSIKTFKEEPQLISNPFCWGKVFNANFIRDNEIFFGNQYCGEDKVFTWRLYDTNTPIFITQKILSRHRYYAGQKNRMLNKNTKLARAITEYDHQLRQTLKSEYFRELYNHRFFNHEVLHVLFSKDSTLQLLNNEEIFSALNLIHDYIKSLYSFDEWKPWPISADNTLAWTHFLKKDWGKFIANRINQ
jgi:glycosyltransferase involved in cell wall biosynthesis